jgi:hypothetical protein
MRVFFDRFAVDRKFDPLNVSGWYSVQGRDIRAAGVSIESLVITPMS